MSTNPRVSESGDITLGTAWQNYGLSMLFIVLVPLLPMFLELIIKNSLAEDSLLITASIYGAAIAIASNNRLTFGIGLVIAVIEATFYGVVTGGSVAAASKTGSDSVARITALIVPITNQQPAELKFASQAVWVIAILIVYSIFERLKRHVQEREEFFEFLKKGGTHP